MFPSSQSAPLLFAGFEHVPVLVLQVPAVWQASEAGQVTGGVVCVHTPLWQVLIPLHMFPSSQSKPLGSKASVGQLGPLPVQNSATSHWPVEGRQVVVAGSKTSTHVLLVPLQWSAASLSQTPPSEVPVQLVVAAAKLSVGQVPEVPVHISA